MTGGDLFLQRSADVRGPCRYSFGRLWDDCLPLAAWLACNPSDADDEIEDMTSTRMIHFSRAIGCGGFVGVNIWALRTPYPHELWRMLKRGEYKAAMHEENMLAIASASQRASVHIVAFGPEPAKRYRQRVIDLLGLFSADGTRNLLCLGTSGGGWPLHPLARGKFAITNDRIPVPWGYIPLEIGDRRGETVDELEIA